MGSEEKMKRMICRVVTCLALLLSCLFMISSCDARSIAIQQVTDQHQSSDREPQQYQVTVSEGSDQLKIVVDEPQSSYAQETSLASGITRTLRDEIPSSYLLEIKGFSVLNSTKPPIYESAAFEAAGYQWRLNFFPNGNDQKDYISLYARIENLPNNSVVDVDLKLFVYNQHKKKYLTIRDGNIKRFDEKNKQRGFGQLLSLSTFLNSSNGYLVNDTCLLGAEIFVIKPAESTETLSWILKPENGTFAWIAYLPKPDSGGGIYSSSRRVGDRNWRLLIYPNGTGEYKGKSLSLFLVASDFPANTVEVRTYGWATVRLLNQISYLRYADYGKQTGGWYPINSTPFTNLQNFISLEDLYDESNGYVVDAKIVLQVQFDIVSLTKVVSNHKSLGPFEAVPIFM